MVEEGVDRTVSDKSAFLESVMAQYLPIKCALGMGGWGIQPCELFGGFFLLMVPFGTNIFLKTFCILWNRNFTEGQVYSTNLALHSVSYC